MTVRYRTVCGILSAMALIAVGSTPPSDAHAASRADTAAVPDRVLRVYSDNIEDLVTNNPDGTCTRIWGPEHLASMLVDDEGRTGTAEVQPPDILILQQLRGIGQAQAYADQLSDLFGYPAGTYQAIVVWDDPQEWGTTHGCQDDALSDRKRKQTNGIIYDTRRLDLADGDVSKYWSAGWLKPGTAYDGGAGCTLYKPPNADDGANYEYKWKRASAIGARFTLKDTGTSVFAATMHLPEQNRHDACAGAGTTGIDDTGIHIGVDATNLMENSTIRIVGMDANRTDIAPTTLDHYGMSGHGTAPTFGSSKIDYLFVKGDVQPSDIDYTVDSTKSNHLALYSFITY